MNSLHKRLGEAVIDFTMPDEERDEAAAMCDETLLEAYDERGSLSDKELAGAFSRGNIFPCLFGSALKNEGVKELLDLICRLAPEPVYGSELSAAVYKIDRDKDGKPFQLSKVRDNEKMSEREQWRKDLEDTEAKIQEAYDLCDAGEITFEERHQRLGWLQNHAAVLRRRLGIKD
jgi:peptide subunit release factor RF-3